MRLLHSPCSSSSLHSGTRRCSIPSALRPPAYLHRLHVPHYNIQYAPRVAVPIATGALSYGISRHGRRTTAVKAQQGPDKGSVAALEAALAAINKILGTYNKMRAPGKTGKQQGSGSNKAAAGATAGPSKLISFSAKASGSVPVKEVLRATAAQQDSSNGTGLHGSHTSSNHNQHHSSKGHKRHKHSSSSSIHKHKTKSSNSSKGTSWLQQLTGQHLSSCADRCDSTGQPLPAAALERSLQAYLALPLEQYSVLDPKLITRLPPGTDVEVTLAGLLAGQKARRAQKKKQQQQQGLEAVLAGSDADNSSRSSDTSLRPAMKELHAPSEEAPDADSAASTGSSASASTGTAAAVHAAATTSSSLEHPAAAAVGQSDVLAADGAGAFLLRIPMKDLLGVDLEPLLVIYVDIEPKHAQVTFRTNRLVIGDPRFDQEFKVDLIAKMNSKVQQPAMLVAADVTAAAAAAAGDSSMGQSRGSSNSSGSANGDGSTPSDTATVSSTAAVLQQDPPAAGAAAADAASAVWQRNSVLSCKVQLNMTIRLPHPLSVVPGPLLSTTAGLVAKLVMQALLPSFLELLATDYGRWANGSTTAARQALPAGSLVASGKQQLQRVQQQ